MNKKHKLNIFNLTMMTVSSVVSIRNLPTTALFGSKLIFIFFIGALFFLIPAALISVKFSSIYKKQGGVYIWIKHAFGKKIAFLAVWFQWIENIIWYPTILSFIAGIIGYLIKPGIENNPYFIWIIIIVFFWILTLINMKGIYLSTFFNNFCTIIGLLIPMTLIIILGLLWMIYQNNLQIHINIQNIFPNFKDKTMWVSLTAVIMSFCGIEISTIYINDVYDPKYIYSKVLTYSVLIILSTLILGSLSIAIIVPAKEINLLSGIMQAFSILLYKYHVNKSWIISLLSCMLVMGNLGSVSNWIIAPTKGLLLAYKDNNCPIFLKNVNAEKIKKIILIGQAVIVSIFSLLFLFMSSINGSYWLLTTLSVQLYMIMYLLIFFAAIKLDIQNIVTKNFKIWKTLIISSLGIIGVIITLIVGFIIPDGINIGNIIMYRLLLIGITCIICIPCYSL